MSTSANGYNALSSKSGSVISENELRGLKYGLSRSQYQAAPDPVKFFIGLEISVADYVGFPLLEKLCGVNNENLNELENSCGAGKVQFLIRGESTPSPDSQTEPLHLFIIASVRIFILLCMLVYFAVNLFIYSILRSYVSTITF